MKTKWFVGFLLLGMACGIFAQDPVPGFDYTLLAKAAPDECFFGIGNTNNLFSRTGIDEEACIAAGGMPKVNQAYVWGLTRAGDDLWFGTGPNVDKLVGGQYMGNTSPSQGSTSVSEYGESAFARDGTVPATLGDWRPADIFVYTLPDGPLVRLDETFSPADSNLFEKAVGYRSAGTSAPNTLHTNGVVLLAGPSLTATDGGGIIVLAFDAASRTLIEVRRFTEYANIRKWISHEGILYTAVTTQDGGGAVLRWLNNPGHPDYPLAFETVGILDNGGAELAVYDNRLFVGTWPGLEGQQDASPLELLELLRKPAGLYRSPEFPCHGLGLSESDKCQWEKVWDIQAYDPDPVCAAVTGIGALHEFDGELYWGTMQVPGISSLAHTIVHGAPTRLIEIFLNPINSRRGLSLFKAKCFRPKRSLRLVNNEFVFRDYLPVDLLYGETRLMMRSLDIKLLSMSYTSGDWESASTGMTPLYGSTGFGNQQNNYTWTMAVYEDRLFVGTMDSTGMDDAENSDAGEPGPGADLWSFASADSPAEIVSYDGVNNYSSYGLRTMVAFDDGLYIGTANPRNLMTDLTDDLPEGGWELIRLRKPVDVPAEADADGDNLADSWEMAHFGSLTDASSSTDSDNDSMSDRDEFIAGTDPNDGSDYLYIDARGETLDWYGAPTRVYTIQTADAVIGPWKTVGKVTGEGKPITFDWPERTSSTGFLRVHVKSPSGD